MREADRITLSGDQDSKLFRIHVEITLEAESFQDAKRKLSDWVVALSNSSDSLPKGFVSLEQEECVQVG